jgi:hypothetical protein
MGKGLNRKLYKKLVVHLGVVFLLAATGEGAGEEGIQSAPGELLVRMNARAGKLPVEGGLSALHARSKVVAVERLFPTRRERAKSGLQGRLDGWVKLKVESGGELAALAEEYARLDEVDWAQPNYLRKYAGAGDDSLFARQWNLLEMGWDPTVLEEERSVLVAVVDSGLDFQHPEMAGQTWQNLAEVEGIAGVDDDGNGYIDDVGGWDFTDAPGLPGEGDYLERDADPEDESGHGTHVAGIIAAAAGNGEGIAGIAPMARIMALRAGFNVAGGGYLEDDDLAAAIVYAVDNGAQVINMSWGDPLFSPLLRDVIEYAHRRGCVLVAAAGNEGSDLVFFPGSLDETIAVAASGTEGRGLAFSNRGPSIDLAAPGSGILSLAPGGKYGERSGTSMAAAHVSGLAALVLARRPHFDPSQVRGALAMGARESGLSGWDVQFGMGIAQVAAVEIDRPPIVQIMEPGTGDGMAPGSVEVRIEMSGVDAWSVDWGRGSQPDAWHPLSSAEGDPGGAIRVDWATDGLLASEYLLRARGVRGGKVLEDRVEVRLLRSGPQVVEARLFRALDGGNWVHLVEWETDVAAGGRVHLRREGEPVVEFPAVDLRTRQRVKLPDDLATGGYAVEIEPRAGGVTGRTIPVGRIEVEPGKPGWAMEHRASLPDGYLLPFIEDIDGDGLAEMGQMAYGGGQYNTGEFYRWEGGKAKGVHSSQLLFIPWNVHDLDGDGNREVMAVDARRVRLLESQEAKRFPDRVVWERDDVWGGEVADLDGDGRQEMFLRSSKDPFFAVLENRGDDRYEEVAVLSNATGGTNQLGARQVVGDLDGDGKGELICGDEDGDLVVFENFADDVYRQIWKEEVKEPNVDARVIGGGVDLDADGREEFVVARLVQEPYQLRETSWLVGVYQATGDNIFAREWQVEVLGGGSSGNGISVADLDGDGAAEIVLALVPDLYVFKASGVDGYELAWHAPITRTYRPAVGDWDGDGRPEIAFNAHGEVTVFSRTPDASELGVPAGFDLYSLGENRIALEWDPVFGATGYRIFRDGEIRVAHLPGVGFEEEGLNGEQIYEYAVAAIDSIRGVLAPPTGVLAVRPIPSPRVVGVERISARQLAVRFSVPMEVSYLEPYRFELDPGGMPSSVVADRAGQRVVVSFGQALPDSGDFFLEIGPLRSRQRGMLAEMDRRFPFSLQAPAVPARILEGEVVSATRVALRFSRPVRIPADPGAVFTFQPEGIRIETVEGEGDGLLLELAPETPLLPLGHRYELRFDGLEDEAGNRINGSLTLSIAAAGLEQVRVFPNPFFPVRGPLTWGYLTVEAVVYIYDMGGQLLRTLEEANGDGGVKWDGRNQAGEPIDSGVYLYKVMGAGEARVGKFALIRE